MAKKRSVRRSHATESLPFPQDLKLADLFLQQAMMQRGEVHAGGMPPQAIINTKVDLGRPDDNTIAVIAEFNATSTYEGATSPAIAIGAVYVLAYQLPAPLPTGDVPEGLAQAFSRQALLNVWPYWREYVQSATSRMGLPPLRMPLLFTSQLREKINID